MRILIADDDPDTVDSQALLLRKIGYEAITCTHGADVMPLVEEHHPDVLLIDLAMPQMSGFDIAMELKENPDLRPKLLIAVTGYGDDAAREETEWSGFDFHFVKPMMPVQLLEVLEWADKQANWVSHVGKGGAT